MTGRALQIVGWLVVIGLLVWCFWLMRAGW